MIVVIVGDKMQVSSDKFNFQIILESKEVEESSEYWQEQCSFLFCELNKNLISGSIEPMTSECGMGEKADVDTLLNILLVSEITLNAFDRIFDTLNTWLEHRRLAKVMLKYEDGSIIELTRLTKSEAFKLMEEHHQKIRE